MAVSGPRGVVLCFPQETAPICNLQCAFPKCAANTAIEVYSAGCTPLHLAVQSEIGGVIERVQTLLQAAPDAALMTDARGRTPLHSAVFWFPAASVLREILHIHPICVSIRVGSGAWGERGAGGQGQTALELLYKVHDCGYKYNFWDMAALIVRASVYSTTVRVDLASVDGKLDQEPLRDLSMLYKRRWDYTVVLGSPYDSGYNCTLTSLGKYISIETSLFTFILHQHPIFWRDKTERMRQTLLRVCSPSMEMPQ